MRIIGLFFPAIISLKIYVERNSKEEKRAIALIGQYALYVLLDNWLAQVIIIYVLNISDVTIEAFNSFPFFTKYVVISGGIALLLPFCIELIRNFFKISVEIGVDHAESDSNE